jgi:hypothetical protein
LGEILWASSIPERHARPSHWEDVLRHNRRSAACSPHISDACRAALVEAISRRSIGNSGEPDSHCWSNREPIAPAGRVALVEDRDVDQLPV